MLQVRAIDWNCRHCTTCQFKQPQHIWGWICFLLQAGWAKKKGNQCRPAYSKSRSSDTWHWELKSAMLRLTAMRHSVWCRAPVQADGGRLDRVYCVRNVRHHLGEITELNVICRRYLCNILRNCGTTKSGFPAWINTINWSYKTQKTDIKLKFWR